MMHSWFPVEWSEKVQSRPHGVILNGVPLVIFRANGKIHVLADRCPHRGAPLSNGSVREGCIVCPYHGWRFEGDGACHSIPGLNCYSSKEIHRVQAYSAEEKYGLIWVCLDSNNESSIPQISIGQNEKRFHFESQVNSSLKDVVENALDPLHTHFVHSGWIRTDTKRQLIKAIMRIEQDRLEAEYCNEIKQAGLIHRILSFGRQVEKSFGRFIHPSLFQIEYQTTRKERLLINGFLSPINEQCSKIFLVSLTDAPIPQFLFKAIVKPLFIVAMKQDKKILEMRFSHIQRFGEGKEVSTQGDLFGPYLDLLLQGKTLLKKEYEVQLYV
jgi:phenylpropionate dioxygenase-like ring-hydroxylating dioxygenase large terminal subunit